MNSKLYEKLDKAKNGDLILVSLEELEELAAIQQKFFKPYHNDYKYCPHCGRKLEDREYPNPYPRPVIEPYYKGTGDAYWKDYTIC